MAKNWIVVTLEEKDGKTEIVNKKAVRLLFEMCKPGKYVVTLDSADQRSLPQNRYYFGVVVKMCQIGMKDLGHDDLDSEEVHEFLKSRFNFTEVINADTGQMERIPRSTTKLNKEQFAEYIGKIQQFAAEFLNIVIPDPGQQTTFDYGNEQVYEGAPGESPRHPVEKGSRKKRGGKTNETG